MPFTCAICSMDIQITEPMLSDDKMNLAHKSCVDRMIAKSKHGVRDIFIGPVASPSPPPPAPPPPLPAAPDSCVPTSSLRFCSECGKPCISMCPAPCLMYVHQNFGYDGGTACSTLHEGKCGTARRSRELEPKLPINSVYVQTEIDAAAKIGIDAYTKAVRESGRNGDSCKPAAKPSGKRMDRKRRDRR